MDNKTELYEYIKNLVKPHGYNCSDDCPYAQGFCELFQMNLGCMECGTNHRVPKCREIFGEV